MALSTYVGATATANAAMCVCMSYVPATVLHLVLRVWCYTHCSGTFVNLYIMEIYCVCSGISSHLMHIATLLQVNNEFVNC